MIGLAVGANSVLLVIIAVLITVLLILWRKKGLYIANINYIYFYIIFVTFIAKSSTLRIWTAVQGTSSSAMEIENFDYERHSRVTPVYTNTGYNV